MTTITERRLFIAWALATLIIFLHFFSITTSRVDLTNVTCGARAMSSGQDPYLARSLQACQVALQASRGFRAPEGLVWQAPLPPLSFVLGSPFARLPSPYGDVLYTAAVLAAAVTLARVYRALGPIALPGAVILVAGALGLHELARGQFAFIALAALGLAAVWARNGRYVPCAIALGVAAVEPHLALPAMLGAAWALPKIRVPLAIVVAVTGAASLLVDLPLALEYVRTVLPLQARAELFHVEQYSLAMPLAAAGLAPEVALRVASLQNLVMLVAGVWLGKRLMQRWGEPAAAIAVPVALGVIGGPYIHMTQLVAVFPLALLVLRHEPRLRALAFAAILPIVLDPEDLLSKDPWVFTMYAAATTLLLARAVGLPRRTQLLATLLAPATAYALYLFARPTLKFVVSRVEAPFDIRLLANPMASADASQQYFIERDWNVLANPQHLWLNALVWAGLLGLAGVALVAAWRRPEAIERSSA